MATPELTDRFELARAAAQQAGRLTLGYFQRDDLAVEEKSDASPVTIADRQAEHLLRAEIARRFPHDAILGEELGEQPGTSGFRWILDPIDGTKSFIRGVPLYGTLVGVEREGQPLIGVILIPALDECIYAARGQGAWHVKRQRAAAAGPCVVATGISRCPRHVQRARQLRRAAAKRAAYERLQYAAQDQPHVGRLLRLPARGYWARRSDDRSLDERLGRRGRAPIVLEAGGTFTDWQGRATIYGGEGIATNGLVLEEVLAITREAASGHPKPEA